MKDFVDELDEIQLEDLQGEMLDLFFFMKTQYKICEIKYSKMGKELTSNLTKIYKRILNKKIDLFAKGTGEILKKSTHQNPSPVKLPQQKKGCRSFPKACSSGLLTSKIIPRFQETHEEQRDPKTQQILHCGFPECQKDQPSRQSPSTFSLE